MSAKKQIPLICLLVVYCILAWPVFAGVAGDVAPRGDVDGQLTAADLVLIKRFVYGDADPTQNEFDHANVAPLGAPDANLDIADVLVVERALYGHVSLPPIPPLDLPTTIDASLTLIPGATYLVNSSVTIEAPNGKLTIPSGTTLLFSNTSDRLLVRGGLVVEGEPGNEVVFSSDKSSPLPSDWDGIVIDDSFLHAVTIDHAIIQYAKTGIRINHTGDRVVTISNSLIRYNNDGIQVAKNSKPTLTFNRIINNDSRGILLDGNGTGSIAHDPQPVINDNQLSGNGKNIEGISYATAEVLVDATRNWWGTSSAGAISNSILDWGDDSGSTDIPIINYGQYLDGPGGSPSGLSLIGRVTTPLNLIAGATYEILTDLIIDTALEQIIPNGTTFLFSRPDHGLIVNGWLTVAGEQGYEVTFTSGESSPDALDWQGILINAGNGTPVNINHAVVNYATDGIAMNQTNPRQVTVSNSLVQYNWDGIQIFRDSSPTIEFSNISYNTRHGIQIDGNGSGSTSYDPAPSLSDNEIRANNQGDVGGYAVSAKDFASTGMEIDAKRNWWGSISVSSISNAILDWEDGTVSGRPFVNFGEYLYGPDGASSGPSLSGRFTDNPPLVEGSTYNVLGNLVIDAGEVVTIPKGTTFLFFNSAHEIIVSGKLIVAGEAGAEVTFTSGKSSPSSGDWEGIVIGEGDNSAVVIDHAVIQYADNGVALDRTGERSITISNSLIQYNDDGIQLTRNSSADILFNRIRNNVRRGILLDGDALGGTKYDPIARINDNQIYNNGHFAIRGVDYATDELRIDATRNWWGETQIREIANVISDWDSDSSATGRPIVNYGQYLDGPNGTPSGPSLIGRLPGPVPLTPGATYEVLSALFIDGGTGLTIPKGTTFLFNDPTHALYVNGELTVAGEAGSEVTFTSGEISPETNDWLGIYIWAGDGTSSVTIDHAVIKHAVDGVWLNRSDSRSVTISNSLIQYNVDGIQIGRNSSPDILNNRIVNNSNRGMYIYGDSDFDPNPRINYNEIHSNYSSDIEVFDFATPEFKVDATRNWWGTTNLIAVASEIKDWEDDPSVSFRPIVDYGQYLDGPGGAPAGLSLIGSYSDTESLTPGAAYEVLSDFFVPANTTLIVPPGTTLLFHDPDHALHVNGSLLVAGAPGNEAVFTSAKDSPGPGNWSGFSMGSGSGTIDIDHAVIEYANNGVYANAGSRLITVRNSLIQYNVDGVDIRNNTGLQLTQNRIVKNTNGISIDGNNGWDPMPVISGNDFYDNSAYHLTTKEYSTHAISLDATGNWWGTTNTSTISGKIFDSNDGGSRPNVDYSNFAGTALLAPTLEQQTGVPRYISPDVNDGIQDNFAFTGTLSEPSDWTAEVLDASGVVVFTDQGFATTPVSVNWDGNDQGSNPVADGMYTLRVVATATADPARTGLAGLDRVDVDNTLPNAALDFPGFLQNELAFDIFGSAQDDNFENYTLDYDSVAAPGSYTTIVSNNTLQSEDTKLAILTIGNDQGNAPNVPNGDYTMRLRVSDKAGNLATTLSAFTVDNISLSSIGRSANTIDLSQSETLSIDFTVNMPGDVTLKLYDYVTGNLVRSHTVNYATAGAHSIPWDGLDDSMNPVVDEAYLFTLEAANGARIGNYDLNSSFGWQKLTNWTQVGAMRPLANDHLVANFLITDPSRVRFRIFDLGSTLMPLGSQGIPFPAGAGTISWNGFDTNSNNYVSQTFTAGVGYKKLPFNSVIVKGGGAPVVTGKSPYIEVKTDPYWIYLSYGQFTHILYDLETPGGQTADVLIKLLPPGVTDIDDPAALEVFNGPRGPGPHDVPWTGILPGQAESTAKAERTLGDSGAHVFAIRATVNGVSTLHRSVINAYR